MWLDFSALSVVPDPVCPSLPVDDWARGWHCGCRAVPPLRTSLLPTSPGLWLGAEPRTAAASAGCPHGSLLHRLFLPPQSNKIEKAVSAAHTFLQKNPKHEMTLKYLNYYRTMLDVDEYLVDLEAQPYEVRR